jgi:hypothetical protein
MISAISIELFVNLAQYNYNGRYYDFHNDFYCELVSYSDSILQIRFREISNGIRVSLKFADTKIIKFEFSPSGNDEGLTIDTIYRGRGEFNGELSEISKNTQGYFYLEFYEGQKIEFWAGSLGISQDGFLTHS